VSDAKEIMSKALPVDVWNSKYQPDLPVRRAGIILII
jgi:hypothetical protein